MKDHIKICNERVRMKTKESCESVDVSEGA